MSPSWKFVPANDKQIEEKKNSQSQSAYCYFHFHKSQTISLMSFKSVTNFVDMIRGCSHIFFLILIFLLDTICARSGTPMQSAHLSYTSDQECCYNIAIINVNALYNKAHFNRVPMIFKHEYWAVMIISHWESTCYAKLLRLKAISIEVLHRWKIYFPQSSSLVQRCIFQRIYEVKYIGKIYTTCASSIK